MSDEQQLARSAARIGMVIVAIAGFGAVVLLAWRGWRWSAGWMLGCAASGLNYRWLRRVTDSLGSTRPKPRKAALLGLRYLLLGGGAYVILKYTAVSLPAALAGLFAPAAAVIVEILIELIYARN
jgi:hypothetical protein